MTDVIVDGFALGDASADRGIGVYLRHVLDGLSTDPRLRLAALVTPAARLPAGIDPVSMRRRFHHHRLAPLEHDLRLPGDLRRAGPDVVWSPAQSPPRRSPAPWVQTLHDLTPLVFPHPILARDARRWRRVGPRLRQADAVIAVSHSTARQAVTFLGLAPDRMHVVHHGVGAEFSPNGPRVQRDRPYLLVVGAWGPHKGMREAAEAASALAEAGYPHELLIAGRQDAWMRAQLEVDVQACSRPERVVVLGHVPDLAALYRGADAVLVTSRAEGFGFPAAEALASGCVVVAFDNTALPEVVGAGGILVPDGQVDALVAELRRLLDAPALRAELRERAVGRAAAFDWKRSVAAHAEILGSLG